MNKAYVKYVAGLILFGLNGIVSSKILLSSMNIVLFRTFLGSILLLGIFWCTRDKLQVRAYPKQTLMLVLSGVSMGLSWIFLYEAYVRIGVGMSSITYYCGPVLVMFLAPVVFKKKITLVNKVCFGVVFIGILLVSLPDMTGTAAMDGFGLVCGFASAVLHALMVIFTMKAPDITGVKNSMLQLMVSFFTVLVFALIKGGIQFPTTTTEWFWLLFLGFVNTGLGCYLYFSEISKLPVTTVSILGYLEPLSAVVFAMLLLGETLSVFELIGGGMILAGAVVSEVTPDKG